MNAIQNRILNFIKKYNLQEKTIIVGFSGGYDSMCLLDVMSKIKPKFDKMEIIVAHYNHNWRGLQSLQEQEICRLFSASKGFEFYTKTADKNIKKTELEARILRYEFFEEACDIYDSDVVFTAHNKDDNAETILYRIIKGTGITGLRGIPENRGIFYRPLLTTARDEIENYCKEYNLNPNKDASNFDEKYNRNYIRHTLIPAMQKINSEVKDALIILSNNAKYDNEIITNCISDIKNNVFKDDVIKTEIYKNLSKPYKYRILHEFLINQNLDYDNKKIINIFEFIEKYIKQKNGATISLTTNRWLYADEKIIEILPPKKQEITKKNTDIEIKIEKLGIYSCENSIFEINKFKNNLFEFPEATANFAYVDFSNIKFPLSIRYRREGDIIKPYGMLGTMKLKKYLNSKGIPRHKRDDIILLCKENEVLWVSGVGLSDKIKVIDKPTHIISLN